MFYKCICAASDVIVVEKWPKASLTGDQKLNGLFEGMKSARDKLGECVQYATYDTTCQLKSFAHLSQNKEILDWIPSLYQDRALDQVLEAVEGRPNAGQWLLETAQFQKWIKQAPSKLWYTGKCKLFTEEKFMTELTSDSWCGKKCFIVWCTPYHI